MVKKSSPRDRKGHHNAKDAQMQQGGSQHQKLPRNQVKQELSVQWFGNQGIITLGGKGNTNELVGGESGEDCQGLENSCEVRKRKYPALG